VSSRKRDPDAVVRAVARFLANPGGSAPQRRRLSRSSVPVADAELLTVSEWVPPQRWRIAFSGGRDSTVLLNVLARLCPEQILDVMHVHHGLHPEADAHALWCAEQVRQLNLPFVECRVSVPRTGGEGLEAAARRERYRVLAEGLAGGDCVLTGHHADDQAETLFLAVLRGRGPRGLAAMPELRPLGAGWLGRPLLSVAGAALGAYALAEDLHWREDPTNRDDGLARNYLRRQVIPGLQSRFAWPAGPLRVVQLQQEANSLLNASLDARLDVMACMDMGHPAETRVLERASLLAQPALDQIWLVYRFLDRHGVPPPLRDALREYLRQLGTGAVAAVLPITGSSWQLRSYQSGLYLVDTATLPEARELVGRWNWPVGQNALDLADGRCLQRDDLAAAGVDAEAEVQIGFRQGGERIFQHGVQRSLKSILQEKRIPPWRRPGIPLVYVDGQLRTALWHR
jgi:tRNA(Ile)-lysidine synthase